MALVERVRILNVKGPTLNCKVSVDSSSVWPGFQAEPHVGDSLKPVSTYRAISILSRSGSIALLPRSCRTGSKQKREYSVLPFAPPPPPPPPALGFAPPLSPPLPPAPSVLPGSALLGAP